MVRMANGRMCSGTRRPPLAGSCFADIGSAVVAAALALLCMTPIIAANWPQWMRRSLGGELAAERHRKYVAGTE